ncbi:MAG: hypothetical protein U5K33_05100 [Halofilum sp. (in: g-proteobacteria)]|nr:hypothetical protein [Halofilum sp. (in: g-proteobacteria)]
MPAIKTRDRRSPGEQGHPGCARSRLQFGPPTELSVSRVTGVLVGIGLFTGMLVGPIVTMIVGTCATGTGTVPGMLVTVAGVHRFAAMVVFCQCGTAEQESGKNQHHVRQQLNAFHDQTSNGLVKVLAATARGSPAIVTGMVLDTW